MVEEEDEVVVSQLVMVVGLRDEVASLVKVED